MSEFIAEIVGTFILIVLGHSVNANVSLKSTYGNSSGWVVISIGWGLAVFCGVTVASSISGAHLNPAVTVGVAIANSFEWTKVPIFIAGQMIGAALGAFIVWLNFKNHFDKEPDSQVKLGVFSTSPAIKDTPLNFICEVTGTFILVFVILFITGPELKAEGGDNIRIGLGSIGAIPVTFLVIAIGMGLGGTTGYAINPARDLAPRIMHTILPIKGKGDSNWRYAWIPVLGPLTGGALAAILFRILE